MQKLRLIFFSLLLISSFISCKKSSIQPDVKKDVDIYITGYTTNEIRSKAAYWKNGNLNLLGSNDEQTSGAGDIAVQGSDVYVSGSRVINDKSMACYWKNGVRHDLLYNDFETAAVAIALKGNDIYVIGHIYNSSAKSVCWKNGVKTDLIPDDTIYAEDILINGDDIYISGTKFGKMLQAVYCKNGVITELPTTDAITYPSSVALGMDSDGENIYIAGHQKDSAAQSTGVYWKNGIPVTVSNSTWTVDVDVQNREVYLVGEKLAWNTLPAYPKVWKNGVELITFNPQNIITYNSKIAVSLDNIYTIGLDGRNIAGYPINALFKNGVRESFSNISAVPTNIKIFVK